MLSVMIWLTPLLMLVPAFFTSKISGYRLYRYLIYILILFIAFILDLQATSFINDRIDIIFNRIFLLVTADFFFRWARQKNRTVRIIGIVIGLVFFLWGNKSWFLTKPDALALRWNAPVITVENKKGTTYHIKARTLAGKKGTPKLFNYLYKRRLMGLLEQECSSFPIPEGYERADFSFKWQLDGNGAVEVRVIGDSDTLWTLSGNTKPR